jgi:hypothetical protein
MQRQAEHVLSFLLAELGTQGSIDGQQRLVLKGRFTPKVNGPSSGQLSNAVLQRIAIYSAEPAAESTLIPPPPPSRVQRVSRTSSAVTSPTMSPARCAGPIGAHTPLRVAIKCKLVVLRSHLSVADMVNIGRSPDTVLSRDQATRVWWLDCQVRRTCGVMLNVDPTIKLCSANLEAIRKQQP